MEPVSRASAWSAEEVAATVDAYFQFWLGDAGDWETKMDVYRDLHRRFPARSVKAFEFKFQNVSGALFVLGMEYMPGLQPRVNFQKLVLAVVEEYLDSHPQIRSAVGAYEKSSPDAPQPKRVPRRA